MPTCFRKINFVDLMGDSGKFWWDLSIRSDRQRVYENVVTQGTEGYFALFVDGALLIDMWDELDLPEPIRGAWDPLIEANRRAPSMADFYVRRDETRLDPAEIVGYASTTGGSPRPPRSLHR